MHIEIFCYLGAGYFRLEKINNLLLAASHRNIGFYRSFHRKLSAGMRVCAWSKMLHPSTLCSTYKNLSLYPGFNKADKKMQKKKKNETDWLTLTKVHPACDHPQMVQAAVGQSLTGHSLPHYIHIKPLLQQIWPFRVWRLTFNYSIPNRQLSVISKCSNNAEIHCSESLQQWNSNISGIMWNMSGPRFNPFLSRSFLIWKLQAVTCKLVSCYFRSLSTSSLVWGC